MFVHQAHLCHWPKALPTFGPLCCNFNSRAHKHPHFPSVGKADVADGTYEHCITHDSCDILAIACILSCVSAYSSSLPLLCINI